jgi:hypothetical protein
LGAPPATVPANNASGGATVQDVRNEQSPPPQPRKISALTNETLGIPPGGGSSSSAFNQAPAPAVPEPDPAVIQPNGAGAEGEKKETPLPDISEHSARNPEGTTIQRAVPVSTPRPERLEKLAQEMRLRELKEREAQRAAARTQPQPAPPPVEYIAQPARPVAPAVPTTGGLKPAVNKASANTAANAANPLGLETAKATPGRQNVQLSLAPVQPRQQIGKAVVINVQVEAQTALSSASIALKFDATKLKLKSVRDGGMLGSEPDLMHNVEGGNLLVTLRPGKDKSAKAAGRLIVIEFIALDAGTTEIAFNGGETQIKLNGDLAANVNAAPAQIAISRETVSSNDKK